ncbi:hypothetical protein DC522_22665 [Microvirga sp. KLBC 81]|uniref:M10 family metallopeptidase C-terminal domain-containing protein n=1 Tax=Microvirga sp. KLBC 81 TaxID=1862707 RepID=UPI000D50866B|nr:calcium-binding protein [Microvirga sp. KLBC 81]PVE22118.1 hypothetical protein DC522_22665 [Microvirga sp. KLBC 81]
MVISSQFVSLLAPKISVGAVNAQGGVYSKYESDFTQYAAQHWSQEGSSWENANYYDRAEIFYNWYNRTDDSSYLTKANALALDYRKKYLEANNYSMSAHWSQIAGVALHYLATGDEASHIAVGKVADQFANPWYTDNLGNLNAEMDNRIQARTLEAFLYAKKINAPSVGVPNIQPNGEDWGVPGGNNWDALLQSSLDKILSSQGADGGYHFAQGGVVPFMTGLLNDTLIDYYTNYKADSRILTAVKKSLDYLWTHTWDEASQSFMYVEKPNSFGEVPEPAPDLNNMISSGFGWVYKMTGDTTYKERGDKVFAGGVNGAWLEGSKQFNEQYTSSLKYLAYTLGDGTVSTPTPTPEPTPLPEKSPYVTTGVSYTLAADEVNLTGSGSASISLTGNSLANVIKGNTGANRLYGNAGNDKLYGGAGNDVLIGGAGWDYLDGGAGTDTVSYANATGLLADLGSVSRNNKDASGDTYAGVENLAGSAYADSLRGNDAANVIWGGSGNDTLHGRGGNDTLSGDTGADVLFGGAGTDRFYFHSITQSPVGIGDTIRDFVRGVDRIDLRAIDANSKLSGDQAFSFIGSKAFSGQAGQLKFSSGVLSGDLNGDRVADFQIKVSGISALASDNLYL